MHKKLIICSDGTWNHPTQKDDGKYCPSNVYLLVCGLSSVDMHGVPQVIFYDEGIGASDNWFMKKVRGFSGWGINRNIEDCYRFIMNNYADGDEIYFVGFSRGAYTVRSTAGMIRKCGILKKEHADKYEEAETLYRDKHHPDCEIPKAFRKKYSIDEIKIKCIAVWDTVGSLGIPVEGFQFFNKWCNVQFHDVKLSSRVDYGFQALAIDEHRSSFKPAIWEIQEHSLPGQTVKQVWFPGSHRNVGGGYINEALSNCALKWMVEVTSGIGLVFDMSFVKKVNDGAKYNGTICNSRVCFYKLQDEYMRPIGKAMNSNEAVSEEAVKRYNDPAAKYHPPNLAEYMEGDAK